jgi:hypothetical protein
MAKSVKTYHTFFELMDGCLYAVVYQRNGRLGKDFGGTESVSVPTRILEDIKVPIKHIHGTPSLYEIYTPPALYEDC